MSDEPQQEIIIVRRRVEGEEGHHGGAWKIAYADFVTAMMAFFLVLWILNSTNKDSQTIIARYFNPVKMEDFAKNKKGIASPQNEEKPGANEGDPDKAPPAGQEQGKAEQKGKDPNKDPNARSMMNEETLFQESLMRRWSRSQARSRPSSRAKAGGSPSEPAPMDSYRDPFKPAGADPDEDDNADAQETAERAARHGPAGQRAASKAAAARGRTAPAGTGANSGRRSGRSAGPVAGQRLKRRKSVEAERATEMKEGNRQGVCAAKRRRRAAPRRPRDRARACSSA